MGIIDDYMAAPTDNAAPVNKGSGSSIVDQYMAAPKPLPEGIKKVYITPKPPISGATKEQSDIINAQSGMEGGDNTRAGILEGIKNLPSNMIEDSLKNFKSAGETLGSATSDILSSKPAFGVGKLGVGVLQGLTAIPSAAIDNLVSKPVTELTGNPDIGDRAGLIASAAVPIAPTASAITKAIPKNKALKTLVESIGEQNLPQVVREMKANPRLTPADLSPKVMQDTQRLFVTEGPHQNYLANTVQGRLESAKTSVEDAMNTHLGTSVNALDKLNELRQNIRDVGKTKINPAVEGSKPVDLTDTIANIDKQLKPGITSVVSSGTELTSPQIQKELGTVRRYLTDNKSMRTSPQELHDIQSALRSASEKMMKSSEGQDRRIGGALQGVRNDIVSAIDKASGGKYKPALKEYRDEFHIEDAFQHGHDSILTNSKAIENRPEFFKDWVKNASKEELEAAREGARVAIDTQINGFKHAARRGTDIGQVEFNKARIEALFGKEEADKLFTKLEHERKIADTNNKLVQGSQTAMREASKAAIDLPEKSKGVQSLVGPAIAEGLNLGSSIYAGGGLPGAGVATYYGLKGLTAAKDAIALKLAKEHNANLAKYALPTEGPDREALIQSLESIANRPPKQSLLRRSAGALSKIVQP